MTSRLSLRKNHTYNTLRWPGLKPSMTFGMARCNDSYEKRTSSEVQVRKVSTFYVTFVDEIFICDVGYLLTIVQGQLVLIVLLAPRQILHVRTEPRLAIIDTISLEAKLDLVVTFGAAVAKGNTMTRQLGEVLLELNRRRRSQTLFSF